MESSSLSLRLQVVDISRTNQTELKIKARDLKLIQKTPCSTQDSDVQIIEIQDDEEFKNIIVGGVWVQNTIIKDTIIHLLNPLFDISTKTYTINNSNGFMVIEPDSLLTCTLVASSLFCERKTWLNNVFLGEVGTNRAMLVGTLVHEVFQHGVKNKLADIDKLVAFLDELLDNATVMLEIYSIEAHISDIRKEAISYISSVKEWIEKYMFAGPKFPLTNDSNIDVKIVNILDIEENVWSTKYGLKGKIDVTGTVKIHDKKAKTSFEKILPLELKTGNPNLSSSHAAQVSLYSMMIEDRYTMTNQGLVIYLKDKAAMHNVVLTHNIKRDLIQRRNHINYHMKSYFNGPEMIDQTRLCKNCERMSECILMSNLYSPGTIDSYPIMKALEPEAIGHLDEAFKDFFKRYHEKLVSVLGYGDVDGDVGRSGANTSFWTYTSDVAEERKSGFGKLQVVDEKTASSFVKFIRHPNFINMTNGGIRNEITDSAKKKRKIEDFFKPIKKIQDESLKGKPFDKDLIFTRHRFAISLDNDADNMESQNSSTAIAIGFINDIKEDCITMKIYEGGANLLKSSQVYRIDRIEKKSQADIERTVLVRLLNRQDWRCDKIRQLILDPNFKQIENIKLNLWVLSTEFDKISKLDEKQQKFVVEAVSTDNYCILNEDIEPNKSQVYKIMSVFLEVMDTLDRSTLIVSGNIDNLCDLMKSLQSKKIKFILIDDGKSTKARYQFPTHLVKVAQSSNIDLSKKFDAYIRQHDMAPIVITSYAMSIGGLLFTRKRFDYCVAFDCDSTELLVGLSPMFSSDRYVIVDIQKEGARDVENVSLGTHLRGLRNNSNNE